MDRPDYGPTQFDKSNPFFFSHIPYFRTIMENIHLILRKWKIDHVEEGIYIIQKI